MKKIIFALLLFVASLTLKGQTATNFNCADCKGSTIDLFSKLDSGKVVVLCWVMPCATCIPAAKTTYNVVESFQTSNPGRVFYYLCDDYANTTCTTLNGWANNNGIPTMDFSYRFSDASIKMSDYGSTAMPKVVVLGGSAHTVFYNVDNTVDPTAMITAINNALAAPSGIESKNMDKVALNVYPNPANNMMNLSFALNKSSNVTVEIMNNLGQSVYAKNETYHSGEIMLTINTIDFSNGVYFLKICDEIGTRTLKFSIAH